MTTTMTTTTTTTHKATPNDKPRSFGCRMVTTSPDGTVATEVGCGADLWAVLMGVMDPFQDATDMPIAMVGTYLGRF